MKRNHCPNCLRAERACICGCVLACQNHTSIGVLQHPSERLQAKGSARLAALSLQCSVLWSGERLADAALELVNGQTVIAKEASHLTLHDWLAKKPTFLLYPETQEKSEKTGHQTIPAGQLVKLGQTMPFQILVLDGTWRKTHKMLMLNPELQALPRVTILPSKPSQYQIRKQKNAHSLATIEAIAQLLAMLEVTSHSASRLEQSFANMQQKLVALRED